MTDSPDPKKRGKKTAKRDAAKKSEAPPPSDPTLSDRAAGGAGGAPAEEGEHGQPEEQTFDVPVSGFFEGEKADNENHAAGGPGNDKADGFEPVPSSDVPPAGASDDDDEFGNNDVEATVNLTGDELPLPGRDDLEEPTHTVDSDELPEAPLERVRFQQAHLRGAIEALVFASDAPLKAGELARRAHAPIGEVREQLLSLKSEYTKRGIHLDEVAGGWVFRTSPEFAPFVRELTKEKPVRLTRAQLETLAILAYRQPITRPEIDDIRGVDSGPVLKLLLERDLIRILGKKEEAGRPILYGTTSQFLEFFGLKSLKDLPTLTEFTELNEDSRRVVEEELGESLETIQEQVMQKQAALDLESTKDEESSLVDARARASAFEDAAPDLENDEGELPTKEIAAPIDLSDTPNAPDVPDVSDTAEHPAQKQSRDTFTNEAEPNAVELTDEELYPDDNDDDFDDDDDDDDDEDDDDEDDEDDEDEIEIEEEPEK